ncbi:hypothetical protein CTI12_AA324300 [Artemisia annua]|uniref:Uncharacterized protein n=1 Tax=Artemisia annua TaxID=35608 RepID=A0A2U1MXM6_ARTAN|nr:hypothetical protein CTI12_AA324300 [Artemisia annua]
MNKGFLASSNGKKGANTERGTTDDVVSVADSAIDANLVEPVSQGSISKDGEGVANALPKDTNHDANIPDGDGVPVSQRAGRLKPITVHV